MFIRIVDIYGDFSGIRVSTCTLSFEYIPDNRGMEYRQTDDLAASPKDRSYRIPTKDRVRVAVGEGDSVLY